MILYDWATVYRKSGGEPASILHILAHITFPTTPKNVYSPNYKLSQVDWSGDCYLLRPEKIIQNRDRYTDQELAEYVALASFRSYAYYQATGDATLSEELCPVAITTVTNSRLLSKVQGKLYFAWEEVTH